MNYFPMFYSFVFRLVAKAKHYALHVTSQPRLQVPLSSTLLSQGRKTEDPGNEVGNFAVFMRLLCLRLG